MVALMERFKKQSKTPDQETLQERFEKAVTKTRREEYVRMTLNYKIVSALSYFNFFFLLPLAFSNWFLSLFGLFDFALLNFIPWYLYIPLWLLPYVTWHYSTITVPVKNGKAIVKDFSKTAKGRMRSVLLNLVPFYVLSWSAAAKWVFDNYLVYLLSIRLQPPYNNILITDDLDSLVLILFFAPVVVTSVILFMQVRDFMINKDLLEEHFTTWETPYFQRYAHEYQIDSCDVIVGYEIDTKKPIIIKEDARFLHEAIIGATGSGKTSTTLLLRIAQDLLKYATGVRKNGLVFLEPKGDGVDDVLTLCKKLGIPDSEITVIDPTKPWSKGYNPFFGNRDTAASDFTGTLSALAQDQDQFFKDQQNEAATMYSLLAKIRFGDETDITHIEKFFSDARYLANAVEEVRALVDRNLKSDELTKDMRFELSSYERIVSYFEDQVLDYKTYREKEDIRPVLYPIGHKYQGQQMVENKKEKFITGAKKYLNDIAQNPLLLSLFVSKEGELPFDPDEFLTKGGIVLVNTALGELDELSLMFGQFFIRNFQSAVFRRAKEDKKQGVERIPVFFYVDEFPLYANEAFERFLTLGRSYKVGTIIAMQSIAQLEAVGLNYRKSVMGNASHKTVFGRGPVEDNEYFSKEFGEELIVEESTNESGTPMTNESQSWGYRLNTQKKLAPRFIPTDIRELPFKQMIVQVVNEQNSIAKPKKAIGQFVHESPFIQRFMELVENDIKSTVEKEVFIEQHITPDLLNKFTQNIGANYETYQEEDTEQSTEVLSTLNAVPEQTNSLADKAYVADVAGENEDDWLKALQIEAAGENWTEDENIKMPIFNNNVKAENEEVDFVPVANEKDNTAYEEPVQVTNEEAAGKGKEDELVTEADLETSELLSIHDTSKLVCIMDTRKPELDSAVIAIPDSHTTEHDENNFELPSDTNIPEFVEMPSFDDGIEVPSFENSVEVPNFDDGDDNVPTFSNTDIVDIDASENVLREDNQYSVPPKQVDDLMLQMKEELQAVTTKEESPAIAVNTAETVSKRDVIPFPKKLPTTSKESEEIEIDDI